MLKSSIINSKIPGVLIVLTGIMLVIMPIFVIMYAVDKSMLMHNDITSIGVMITGILVMIIGFHIFKGDHLKGE